MNWGDLNTTLTCYEAAWPDDGDVVGRFQSLLKSTPEALLRTGLPGHITASAWVVEESTGRVLMTHHRKLGRWLQCGGHADGDPLTDQVALREVQEESGLKQLSFVLTRGRLLPFDVDIHGIPAYGDEPAHDHYDIRYLLLAAEGQPLEISDESHDVAWIDSGDIGRYTDEESVLRLARRAVELMRYTSSEAI